MFSRSEKTEEVVDVMAEPSSGQKSPMVLAALAGLLAIAGAFLLVWYLNSNSDGEVASDSSAVSDSPDAVAPTNGGDGTTSEATRQVLVVTQTIPRGTSVNELIAAPTVYLSARAVPEQFVTASAITSVAELQELRGLVLASEALPGEQLLAGRFRDPGDFESNETTFLETQTDVPIPEGHHAIAIEVPASNAVDGTVRAGELVTVIANFRTKAGEISVVVLNAVEVIDINRTGESADAAFADGINNVGVAAFGNRVVTLAVEPDELTDLTYAMGYGEIILASAPGVLDNEGPRAVTTMRQIAGDDGIWVGELEEGNIVEIVEKFPAEAGEDGQEAVSIEVDITPQGGPDSDDLGGDLVSDDEAPLDAAPPADGETDGESDG